MSRAVLTLAAISTAAATQVVSMSPISNEPKRKFYENEHQIVPLPGTVTPSTPEEAEILGPRSLINGVTVRSTAALENAFKSSRVVLHDAYTSSYNYLYDKKHAVLKTERQVAETVAALHSRREDLFPNVLYIVIAGLSGNIFARNRGILVRAIAPISLGTIAFGYFLPQTFQNTTDFLWQVEQKTVPVVAQHQVSAYQQAQGVVNLVEQSAVSSQKKAQDTWQGVRQRISWATGLNLDEEVSKK